MEAFIRDVCALAMSRGAPAEATSGPGVDLASLWENFASPAASAAGVEGGGGYGTATIETTLAPGQSRVLSFVLGWAYPHRIARRYEGAMFVGNHYSKRFRHSRQPALEPAARWAAAGGVAGPEFCAAPPAPQMAAHLNWKPI